MTTEQIAAFEAKLRELKIPAEEIKVFGAVRCNIHIKCLSESAATKWLTALRAIFPRAYTLSARETAWEAKENKGTCLIPTMRHGWHVGLIA